MEKTEEIRQYIKEEAQRIYEKLKQENKTYGDLRRAVKERRPWKEYGADREIKMLIWSELVYMTGMEIDREIDRMPIGGLQKDIQITREE